MFKFLALLVLIVPITVFIVYWNIMKIAKCLFCYFDVVYENTVGVIILTIDDVPYEDKSFENILDVLKKYNNKAIFFVISSQVTDTNKHLLIRAIHEGHHLANHGKHNTMHALYRYDQLDDELDSCQKLIDELYIQANTKSLFDLKQIKYFRPGCGIVTSAIDRYCKEKGYTILLGSNYCSDPKISIKWLNKWYIMKHLKYYDIIILHDRKWTAEMLDELFSEIPKTKNILNEL